MSACALHSYWMLAAIIAAVYFVAIIAGWVARRLVYESLADSEPEL